jgi:hypothetical protein
MSSFIIPLTIESRKIVFLELTNYNVKDPVFPEVIEDNFVVRLPERPIRENDLLSFSKSNVVQALETNMKDIPLGNFTGYLETALDGNVQLLLSNNATQGENEILTQCGRCISLAQSDDLIKLSIISGHDVQSENLKVKIKMDIKMPVSVRSYYGFLNFQVVPKADIRFLALDFGSEASQMREAHYAPGLNLALLPQVTNIFRIIKSQHSKDDELSDDLYEQYESPILYKSVFYANKKLNGTSSSEVFMGGKVYKLNGGIRMMVPTSEVNAGSNEFLKNHVKIPNLKLVRNSHFLGNEAEFLLNAGGQLGNKTLGEIRGSLYMSLLKNMLDAYLSKMEEKGKFLRMTLLVPNIYQPEDVLATKNAISEILGDNMSSGVLNGFEVDCLSESDASFLGAIPKFTVEKNHYYIVVDCGKGTTDYSVVEMEEGTAPVYRPLYRNGFAGAGNYITYAFIKSALYYLTHNYFTDNLKKAKVRDFLEARFSDKDVFFHSELFRIAESWKKAYSTMPFPNKDSIEQLWNQATSGDINLDDCFDGILSNKTRLNFLDILKKIPCSWDWNNYVSRAINDVVNDITMQLTPVIGHQNKHSKCGGIIITGRGAYFTPLADAITKTIQQIDGMSQIKRIELGNSDLKSVCLDGIFNHSVRYYADLTATPIEVDKENMTQVKKKENAWWKKFFGSGGGSGAAYDPENNSIEVINTNNLLNTGILIGGTLYDFSGVNLSTSDSTLHLIPLRSGVLLLEKNREGQIIKQHLLGTGELKRSDEQRTLDSLYPNWHRSSILESL